MKAHSVMNDRARDRRALTMFLVLAFALSGLVSVPVLQTGSLAAWDGWALPLLMWAPGAAGIVTSLVVYRSLRPLGLTGHRRTWRWALLCLCVPLGYTLLIYPALAGLGLVGLGHGNFQLSFFALGLLISLRTALGEELGWRGFAAPVMERLFGFFPGQFALGLVWFLYHLPMLLLTDYGKSAHPLFGNAMFLISVIGLSFFLGWVRRVGGSVWPCALLHASHNLVFLHLFDPVSPRSPEAGWLVGEQGALFAGAQLLLGIFALRAVRRA